VVLGADSTTTIYVYGRETQERGREQYFNFAQKIFEVGEAGSFGILLWGLGSLGEISHRTLISRLADSFEREAPASVAHAAQRWADVFWPAYQAAFRPVVHRINELEAKKDRSAEEERLLRTLIQNFSGGFCIGGHCPPERTPEALEINYSPNLTSPPQPVRIPLGAPRFWGCPNLIDRLLFGADRNVLFDILQSGNWTATPEELIRVVDNHRLGQPRDLPIREAIDWVHASIYATIKTMKFSHLAPVCGGPIEIAVITSDRPFRWVLHKSFRTAVSHDALMQA
jgi:hypothetical protein